MRPIAPMTRQWIGEKNSFPIRGLVMYHWSKTGWAVNCELIRISRDDIEKKPVDEVAYEIALSAMHRFLTSTPGSIFEGETTPVNTARGTVVAVPALAFELAEHLKAKVIKLIEDGGGGIGPTILAKSAAFHARLTTGNPKNAQAWNIPKVDSFKDRKVTRLAYEARNATAKDKAMALRRK